MKFKLTSNTKIYFSTKLNKIYYEDSEGYCYKIEKGKKIEYRNGKYYIDGLEAVLKK